MLNNNFLCALQECFVYEGLVGKTNWQHDKVVNSAGEPVVGGAEKMECPKGWVWEDDWAVDTRRACDEDGKHTVITLLKTRVSNPLNM